MSIIFKLTGTTSVLKAEFNPPIVLDDDVNYVLGLTVFESYFSIPNVSENLNNMFYYGDGKSIALPTGSYELASIETYIQEKLLPDDVFSLKPDPTTLCCSVKCTQPIDFTRANTIAPLLGFHQRILPANKLNVSDETVKILSVNSICISCNITTGAYENGETSHLIHHFFPLSKPGMKVVEAPDSVIYLPVNVRTITELSITISDQDGKLLDFRGETITVGLHLKQT